MSSFRFIHCSDLHIDSPFRGLGSIQPDLAGILRRSTFGAFENIAALAVTKQVDAVLIAGDVYDSADKSLQAQLKFHRILKTLAKADIPVFVAHGNHDPLAGWSASLSPPEGVVFFGGEAVERHPVHKFGKPLAWVHGISYPTREVNANLALGFRREDPDCFAVGVLHANVGKDPNHDNYAPCSLEDLTAAQMDYWALGHIHAHRVLRQRNPAVVYPGNTQARHFNEAGPKGCCLVTLNSRAAPEIEFLPADAVRFATGTLDCTEAETLEGVVAGVRSRCARMVSEAGPRGVLIRLRLTGRTRLHEDLLRPGSLAGIVEEVQSDFTGHPSGVWIELTGDTDGDFDMEALKQGNDFIAELLGLIEAAEQGQSTVSLTEALKPLYESWPGARYLDPLSAEERAQLLQQSKHNILDSLLRSS